MAISYPLCSSWIFFSNNEKQKSKEFFEKIIELDNPNPQIKIEAQKRLQEILVHKFFYLLFLIIFTTQCSLDTKSGFWTKTEKIEKENKVIKILSQKNNRKEFNPI